MDELEQAQRDVDTARAALASITERHHRGLAGASAIADAEARLDRALDRLDAAAGLSGPAGDDLDAMDALEAAYHEGAQ